MVESPVGSRNQDEGKNPCLVPVSPGRESGSFFLMGGVSSERPYSWPVYNSIMIMGIPCFEPFLDSRVRALETRVLALGAQTGSERVQSLGGEVGRYGVCALARKFPPSGGWNRYLGLAGRACHPRPGAARADCEWIKDVGDDGTPFVGGPGGR